MAHIDANTTLGAVAIITAGVAPGEAKELGTRLLKAWCSPDPAPDFWPIDLDATGQTANIEPALSQCRAAVIISGGGRLFPHLRRLVGLLEERATPAILLLPVADAQSVAAAGIFRSLVPLPRTLPDSAVAAALYALTLRQRAFSAMNAEMEMDRLATEAARRQMELHEHETSMAVMVQRTILPHATPDVNGLEIASIFRPGSSLSGDVYDVVKLDEFHTGFFVADACGHGVAAAMLTMLVSRLLPMKEISGHSYRLVPPGEALSRFNAEFVRRRGELSTLITAIYGIIDSRTGQVTVAGAGHPPVVVTGPRGIETFEDNGPPAGVYDEFDYPQLSFILAPDQTMLMYTDGFETCFGQETTASGRQRPATNRYMETFRRFGLTRAQKSLADAVAGINGLIDAEDGSLHQIDDITLLAVGLKVERASTDEQSRADGRQIPLHSST